MQLMFDAVPEILPIAATQVPSISDAASGVDAETMAVSQAVAQQIATADWLGPLAPIALSPFFGLALLSGGATYGPDWVRESNTLLSEGSALNNPWLFWCMLLLAALTSVPRLTKVSKPFALAAEKLETYSAIIIMLAVRFTATSGELPVGAGAAMLPGEMPMELAAGLPLDVLLGAFAVLNIVVINLVKLCFEFLVFLVPFPSIDAFLELANKFVVAGLTALYMVSPVAATLVNLLILGVCLLVFGWAYRRLQFCRSIVAGPFLAWLCPPWFRQRGSTIDAFCDTPVAGLPRYSKVQLDLQEDGQVHLLGGWLWNRCHLSWDEVEVETEPGLFWDQVVLHPEGHETVRLWHRKWTPGDDAYRQIQEELGGGAQPA